jgi:hypothetical protein
MDRAEPLSPAQGHDPALEGLGGLARAVVRARGAVAHAREALGAVPVSPFLRGPGGDHEHLRCCCSRPFVVDDQTRQPQTRAWGQDCVSVGHEGLLVVKRCIRKFHFTTGGLHLSGESATTDRNNVPGHHS